MGCSRKPSSLEVYCLKQARLFPRIRDLTKQRGIWARTHKKSICVPEKKFILSFQIFVINDFSKCEVESEWRCSVGSSKKASNYLSRISSWRIRAKKSLPRNGFTGTPFNPPCLCERACLCAGIRSSVAIWIPTVRAGHVGYASSPPRYCCSASWTQNSCRPLRSGFPRSLPSRAIQKDRIALLGFKRLTKHQASPWLLCLAALKALSVSVPPLLACNF